MKCNWAEYVATIPRQWIFYVVADINGEHRPLAGVGLIPTDGQRLTHRWSPADLVKAIDSILRSFRDRSTHRLVTAEKDTAKMLRWGPRPDHRSPLELPVVSEPRWDGSQISDESTEHSSVYDYRPRDEFMSNYGVECPWPVITTVLQGGLSRAPYHRMDWTLLPLEKAYTATNPTYGAILIDITILTNPTYGIVASGETFFERKRTAGIEAWISGDQDFHLMVDDARGDSKTERSARESITSSIQNQPISIISALDFCLFVRDNNIHTRNNIVRSRKTEPEAIRSWFCWEVVNAKIFKALWPDTSPPTGSMPKETIGPESLVGLSVAALVKGTEHLDLSSNEISDQINHLPNFPRLLQCKLASATTGQSRPTGVAELVRIAFEGADHISLVGVQGLSFNALALVLVEEELRYATCLTVDVNSVQGDPSGFAAALLSMRRLQHIYLLADPSKRRQANAGMRQCEVLQVLLREDKSGSLRCKARCSGFYTAFYTREAVLWSLREPVPLAHVMYILGHYRAPNGDVSHATPAVDGMLLEPTEFVVRLAKWMSERRTGATFHWDFNSLSRGRENASSGSMGPLPLPMDKGEWTESDLDDLEERLCNQWAVLIEEDMCAPVKKRLTYAFVRRRPGGTKGEFDFLSAVDFLKATSPHATSGEMRRIMKGVRLMKPRGSPNALKAFFDTSTDGQWMRDDERWTPSNGLVRF